MKQKFDQFPMFPPNIEKEVQVKKLMEKSGLGKYSEEEKNEFDLWKQKLPVSSIEGPLREKNVEDIWALLPNVPNYTKDQVGFFVETKENLLVNTIFEEFVRKKNQYELAVEKVGDSVFFFSVGARTHGVGKKNNGFFYAHSHPDFLDAFELDKEKQENLPILFNKGVLPSEGDLQIFLSENQINESVSGKNRERIYSKNGWIEMNRCGDVDPKKIPFKLQKYRDAYFDLFSGKNELGFTTIEETKEYFKNNFQFDLEYHEFESENNI
ncbi:MAG: hypothetical protein LiPW41_57 [Parcubacteria group bacterium LiPW_41]|nr:MAG: hypothetical protein LiPW41_57 [Parcubacteria group bacterium LiPW_41]